MPEDITTYGASTSASPSTNHTAIVDAADAATSSDGIVLVPGSGDPSNPNVFTTNTIDYDDGSQVWDDLTWRGDSWDTSTLRLDGGISSFHTFFDIRPTTSVTGATFEQLTLDHNGPNQNDGPGNTIQGGSVGGSEVSQLTVSHCEIVDSVTNAISVNASGLTAQIDYVRGVNVSKRIWDLNSQTGHLIAVGGDGTITAHNCHNLNGYGTLIDLGDNAGATATVEDSRAESDTDGVDRGRSSLAKLNTGGGDLTLRRCYAADLGEFGIYATPAEPLGSTDSITIDNVLIETVVGSGLDFPSASGTITLDTVQLTDVDNEQSGGVAVRTEGIDFGSSVSLGTHEVGASSSGSSFNNTTASGTLTDLYRGSGTSLGSPDGLSIGTDNADASKLTPNYPSTGDVGPDATTTTVSNDAVRQSTNGVRQMTDGVRST